MDAPSHLFKRQASQIRLVEHQQIGPGHALRGRHQHLKLERTLAVPPVLTDEGLKIPQVGIAVKFVQREHQRDLGARKHDDDVAEGQQFLPRVLAHKTQLIALDLQHSVVVEAGTVDGTECGENLLCMVWRSKIDTGLERCWLFFCPSPPPHLHTCRVVYPFGDVIMAGAGCDGCGRWMRPVRPVSSPLRLKRKSGYTDQKK